MIVGTAGHIDHGKTSLVKALTGIDTDRLEEEKRRGITIELGFAHLALDDGTVAGVVDVPGHERFVKAMAAGAGGVDLAVLVVAADEGVMPQTREHLDICRLLGVRRGVIAINKCDLLTELGEEWLELLRADLETLVAGTFLEGAKTIPVSAKTGEGLAALRAELTRLAKELPERPSEGPAFLPIDRAFTIKGFGTVLTGTLLSGHLSVEDAVSLLPGVPGPLRIRGLQIHGKPAQTVAAGQRTAVNVAGIESDHVARGMVLTRHDELPPTRMLDVEVTLLPGAEAPLPSRRRLLLHLGTAQAECIVALLDQPELRPGESALAQLRLAAPIAALPGQRFILRGSKPLPGRGATVAGGRILALATARRRRGASELLQPLLEGDVETRVEWLLRQAGYRGLTSKELYGRSGVAPKTLDRALQILSTRGAALLVDRERRLYLSGEVFRGMTARTLAMLEAFHAREPMKEGMSKEELRQRLSHELEPRIFARLVQGLLESRRVKSSGDLLHLEGRG
ncbi:MAG TPA: selenocysteine-specific translation elongation factor, partial [Myxococcaceae bacterium]|nr:selenocysteine-specific translation elongation factor [Myxococcaceae bacterium]